MPVITLTQSSINSLEPQPGKPRTEWCDQACPGLYAEARRTAPGEVTYYLRYKDAGKTTRHLKLGSSKNITLAEARSRAREKQAEIRLGADPSATRKAHKAVPTLREFTTEQYLPYIKPRKRSAADDESRLNHRILPKFGNMKLDQITRKQIVDFHNELKAEGLSGASCDHHVVLIRRMLNLAVQWDVIATNPAEKIALFREPNRKEVFLNDEQLARLLSVLRSHPRRTPCQLFLLLLSTGARLNEGLSMTWEQVDVERRIWVIPASNTKAKRLRPVPLNDTAVGVLEELRTENATGRVFVHKNGRPIKSVQNIWKAVRTAAGVPFLRIHDLRHTFASMLINSGRTLYEVQIALGHSTPEMTQRYAHLSLGTLQEAAATADRRIQKAMPKLLPALPPEAPRQAG